MPEPRPEPAVEANGLGKRFDDRWVVRDVDLVVPAGSVCALLGPNGAGKTTTVRMLTTLLRPDSGGARVGGGDVVRDADRVRHLIGVAGQAATVDPLLTGRANLEMVGRLRHLGRRASSAAADDLLERFELLDDAERPARGYSGGMRRRLDLATALVGEPPVLVLDEPTTGLDPHSRNELWSVLRDRVAGGATLLLTTQYLEEADQLADDVVVIAAGAVIAHGSPDGLKRDVGGDRLEVVLDGPDGVARAAAVVADAAGVEPTVELRAARVTVPAGGCLRSVIDLVRLLDAHDIVATDVSARRPTLDDVFLALVGRHTDAPAEVAA